MSDGWRELLSGFDEVAPSFDVWEVVQHRRRSSPGARPLVVGRSSKASHRSARRRLAMAGKWGLAAVAIVVVLIGLALAAHSRDDGAKPKPAHDTNDHRIVPGVRIGAAAIGDTRTNIESAIGKADSDAHSGNSILATYRKAGVTVTYSQVVRFRGQPVHTRLAVLIRTTSPAYSTTAGIHVGSTLGDLKRAYNVNCAAFNRGGGNDCTAGNTTFSVYEGLTATRPYKIVAIAVTALVGSDGTLLTPTPTRVDLPPAAVPTRVVRVTAIPGRAPSQLLEAILSGLGDSRVVLRDVQAASGGRVWADFAISQHDSYSEWIARMAARVYRDQAQRSGLPDLAGVTLGTDRESMSGDPQPHQKYRMAVERQLAIGIRANAAKLDLTVASLHFLHPEGLVTPVVTFQSTNPRALYRKLRAGCIIPAAFGDYGYPYPYFGDYLRLVSKTGETVAIANNIGSRGYGEGLAAQKWLALVPPPRIEDRLPAPSDCGQGRGT